MLDILRKIHPRQIIWGLLVALFTLIAWVGKHYDTRLQALEQYKKEQNGRLRSLDGDMREVKTDVKWIREALERRR